jgi:hypothetical protein
MKNDTPKKHPGGRPPKYSPELAKKMAKLFARGFTDEEVAYIFDITRQVICLWREKHPEFFDTSKSGKGESDGEVKRALFERAMGYTASDGKVYPPDTTACIFWLKNRQPKEWRDKVDHAVSGDLKINIVKFADKDK